MEWYNWNRENLKLYLQVLTVTSKCVKIQYSENIVYNFQLGADVSL